MTTTKIALASNVSDGLLVKEHGKYLMSTECNFDNISDYNDDVVKFDSLDQANVFIKENEFWALTPVEFIPEL